MPRRVRVLVALLAATFVIGLAACGTIGVNGTTAPANGPVTTDNPFLPKDHDLSDCLGTLEQPNCGSEANSDFRLYITFGVLMVGMGAIGWRIAVAIRRRDRELAENMPDHTY